MRELTPALVTTVAKRLDPLARGDLHRRRDDASVNEERIPILAAIAGFGLAVIGLLLAGAAGAPYLTSDAVNPWVIVFAAGALAMLYALPFALERRMRERIEDRERRWERALLAWGAVAIGVLLAGVLFGVAGDWSGTSLAGTAGLLVTIEAGLVIATMVFWMLSD